MVSPFLGCLRACCPVCANMTSVRDVVWIHNYTLHIWASRRSSQHEAGLESRVVGVSKPAQFSTWSGAWVSGAIVLPGMAAPLYTFARGAFSLLWTHEDKVGSSAKSFKFCKSVHSCKTRKRLKVKYTRTTCSRTGSLSCGSGRLTITYYTSPLQAQDLCSVGGLRSRPLKRSKQNNERKSSAMLKIWCTHSKNQHITYFCTSMI